MKKKWEYKYPERLVSAMVSEDHVLIGDQLYFVHMTNGTYPKAGIYRVDVNTGEAAAVFETCDFLRTIGACRDGRFYFTSLRGGRVLRDDGRRGPLEEAVGRKVRRGRLECRS